MVGINTSLANNVALNFLARNQQTQTNAVRQLSTGLRVSQASEDAASLAIGSRLTAEGAALSATQQNTAQATSFLQTAEGGISQIQGLVERGQQLAVQAGNGTLSDTERGFLNDEFQSILGEIDRIAADPAFGDVNPLAGPGAQTFGVQVGTGGEAAEDQVQTTVEAATTTALGLAGTDLSSAAGAASASQALSAAQDNLISNRAAVGASINRFETAGQALDLTQINTEQARATLIGLDVARAVTAFAQAQGEIGTSVLDRQNE